MFVGWLIQRLRVRGSPLLTPADAAEQRAGVELLHGLAVEFVRATPNAGLRDLARHLETVVPDGTGEGRAIERSPAARGLRPLQATPPATVTMRTQT